MKNICFILVVSLIICSCKSIPEDKSPESYLIYSGNSTKVECRKHYFFNDINEYHNKITENVYEKNTSCLYDFYIKDTFKTQRFYENNLIEVVFFDFHTNTSWLEKLPNELHSLSINNNRVYFIESSFLDENGIQIGSLNYYFNPEKTTVELELNFDPAVMLNKKNVGNENEIRLVYKNKNYLIRYHLQYPFMMQDIN